MNFPDPDSAVFSTEKTCFRLHKREKDWSSPVFLKSRVCDPTETASTLIALDSKFFRQKILVWAPTYKNFLLKILYSVVRFSDASEEVHSLRVT